MMRYTRTVVAVGVLAMFGAAAASAQQTTVVAGPQYGASGFKRLFLGSEYRELWTSPITVPVLDLASHGGGLTVEQRGGRQSETLHFVGGDGREYIFRSVDKFLYKAALPTDVRHTPAGAIAQDQTSSLHPAGAVVVSPLQQALGILHAPPQLVVLPDDPRLGEHRARFAGMLGFIEEKPNEGDDDTPGFAGSSKVVGADKMLERLDESPEHRLDAEEYLTVRLLDFLIGDTDRGGDQWRFASFEREGGLLWRPIPRDRDYAFMHADGLLMKLVRMAYPKMEVYHPRNSNIRSLTFMTRDMDRRLLVGVEKPAWDRVVASVQSRLSDEVIDAAIARMPPEYLQHSRERVRAGLRGRRADLSGIADEFYRMVATEADIHATDEAEVADATWEADGSVRVRISRAAGAAASPYFERRFVPGETREVRLYMHGGDDRVVVRGPRSGGIALRVIGGGKDDVLVDSTTAGAGSVVFYDHRGDNEFVTAGDTRVSTKAYDHPPAGRPQDLQRGEEEEEEESEEEDEGAGENPDADPEEWLRTRLSPEVVQDFGGKRSLRPTADYREGAGLIVGLSQSWRRFGFRHVPNVYIARISALYGIDAGGWGVEGLFQYHLENSRLALGIRGRASEFEAFRFFGFGNDSPEAAVLENTLVRQDEARVRPYLRVRLPQEGYFDLGAEYRYGAPVVLPASPLAVAQPLGLGSFSQAGVVADVIVRRTDGRAVPRSGLVLLGGAAYWPRLLDVEEAYGKARAEARGYLPLSGGDGPRLAVRAGGSHLFAADAPAGSAPHFPVHDAAFLGGRFDLRGYEYNRFAGDAAAFGSAELRVPVTRMELFVRGQLGVFGLADAGRVWLDGESPGGWHTAYGGGVWFSSLGRAVYAAYAQGEIGQLYVGLGLPF